MASKRSAPGTSSEGPPPKRRGGYDASWTRVFPWYKAVYGEGTSSEVVGVFCSLCKWYNMQQENKAGTWTTKPFTLLRKDILQRHKESIMHKEAEGLEATRLASSKDGGLKQILSAKVVLHRKAVIGCLRLVYWLAKEEIAHTTKFNLLRDLVVDLGCEYFKEINLGRNAQYTTEQTTRELLQCLSKVIEENIIQDVCSSEHFSLMTDESTDIAILKQLVLVGRYITTSGVRTSYLHIADIANGRAETIENEVLHYLSDNSLQVNKLCGFGSDGAAVMTGRSSGVAVRLRKHSPKMISVHCVNHKLALAAAHASDSVPYLKQFKSILQTLFFFYQNSPVRMANFHAIQQILNSPSIKCKLAKDVRWLSHESAINAIVKSLPSLLVSLEREASENSEPTALGLHKFMKSYKFIACAYMLADVLPHLSRLSRIFQKKNVVFSLIQPCLKSTIDAIQAYEESDSPNLSKVDGILVSELKDHNILASDSQKKAFKANIKKIYIQNLVEQLHDRFPQGEILDSFNIFDPKSLPNNKEELLSYGQEKLQVLLQFYGEGSNATVDPDNVISEWEGLKQLLYSHYTSMTLRQFLKVMCSDKTLIDMFPNMAKLSHIACLIQVSTAECERGFSAMNRIKTELRNRMNTSTLACLMRISIEGPSADEYNFEKAADLWGGLHNRRITIGTSS